MHSCFHRVRYSFQRFEPRVVSAVDKITDPVCLTIDGTKYPNILLPARVKLKREFKNTTVVAEARWYDPSTVCIHKKFNGTTVFLAGLYLT